MFEALGKIKACCFAALLVLPFAAEARDGKFTAAGGFGKSNLGIDPDYRIGLGESSFNAGTLWARGGYRFSNGFLVEVGYVYYATADFFNYDDEYELNDKQAAIGYAYVLESWRFVGKAGYAFWRLDGEEGKFLNPGDEEELHATGSDPVWTLAVEKLFSSMFGMSLSYQKSDREFGDIELYDLGFNFEF